MFRAKLEFENAAAQRFPEARQPATYNYHVTVMNFAPGFDRSTGGVSNGETLIDFLPLSRQKHPWTSDHKSLNCWNIQIPYEAMEVLVEAVSRNEKHLNAEIDLTKAGQEKIRQEWSKVQHPRLLSDPTPKTFLDAVLAP